VRKAIIQDDAVDVYLKYKSDSPPDKNKKHSKNPERNLSEQGFLFTSFTYSYIAHLKGRRCKFSPPKQGETQRLLVNVFIWFLYIVVFVRFYTHKPQYRCSCEVDAAPGLSSIRAAEIGGFRQMYPKCDNFWRARRK